MFETIQFRAMKQHENEPLDEPIDANKRLRLKVIDCNFEDDQDRQIYLQIMSNCSRNDIKEAALMGTTASTQWNLDRLLKHARSQEATNKQSKYIVNLSCKTSLSTNHTRHNPKQKELRRASQKSYDERPNHRQGYVKPICSNCGYNHADGLCRAKGKTYSHCKKLNHFSTVCKSKLSGKPPSQTAMPYKQRQNRTNYQQRTHHTRESTADVSILDQTFALHPQTGSLPRVNLDMNGLSLKFLIDTGSSVNTIDEKSFNTLKPKPHLKPYPNHIVG